MSLYDRVRALADGPLARAHAHARDKWDSLEDHEQKTHDNTGETPALTAASDSAPLVTNGTLSALALNRAMENVPLVPRAREREGGLYLPSPISPLLSPHARARDKWDTRSDRPRWCDLSSTLFWLVRRGWPALDVAGETIAGEPAWRAWVSRAAVTDLLGVRDRVADPPPIPTCAAGDIGAGALHLVPLRGDAARNGGPRA